MAGPVLSEIERQKRAEDQATFTRNEAAMTDRLATARGGPLGDGEKALLIPFAQWCGQNRVRHCPARPAVVATFIAERKYQGAEIILKTVRAIERLHDFHGMCNPVATAIVRLALDPIVDVEPPRSWPTGDKVRFALLPPDIKAVIANRERQRDVALRRSQNEKRNTDGAVPKTVNGENEMAKKSWNEKRGAYTSDNPGLTQGKPDSDKSKDISKIVDRNQAVNDGVAGGLDSSKAG